MIKHLLHYFAALFAGASLPFAFAPFGFPHTTVMLSLTVLLWLWRQATPQKAFNLGWMFGIGWFGVGVSWIYNSFAQFSSTPLLGAVAITTLFVMFLALYPATLGATLVYFFPKPNVLRHLLAFPALWVLWEWIRSWLLTGFPWLSLGYSQVDGLLANYAPLIGVFGVSGLLALCAGGLIVFMFIQNRWERTAILIIFVLPVISVELKAVNWTRPIDDPIKVALIQANEPQEYKWYSAQFSSMRRYLHLSRQHRDADLIIWPETAVPMLYTDMPPGFLQDLRIERERYKTDFLIGVPLSDQVDGLRYFNGVMSIAGQQQFYRKNHLVPFGEYVPLLYWFGDLLDFFQVPYSAFTAGEFQQENFYVARQIVGMSICYEAAFGEKIRTHLPGATLLANISNDSWFGDSLAPHQHLQIARMRALEMGRYLLRTTNTGISAIIDPKGKIVSQSPQFRIHVLRGTVQPYTGMTPYARMGDALIISISAGLLLLAGFLQKRFSTLLRQTQHK